MVEEFLREVFDGWWCTHKSVLKRWLGGGGVLKERGGKGGDDDDSQFRNMVSMFMESTTWNHSIDSKYSASLARFHMALSSYIFGVAICTLW